MRRRNAYQLAAVYERATLSATAVRQMTGFGTTAAQASAAIQNVFAARASDMQPIDFAPDACWRCDATPGETDVGLCSPCHQALTA